MKIVKWVTGLDHTQTPSKLLYPAFEEKLAGRPRDEIERAWQEAENLVKACIRRNGFKFSGEYHQRKRCLQDTGAGLGGKRCKKDAALGLIGDERW